MKHKQENIGTITSDNLPKDYSGIRRSPEVGVDERLKEISAPSSGALPYEILIDEFQQYSVPSVQRHWHETLQFTVVLEGCLEYVVNQDEFLLSPGDGIFINNNILHRSRAYQTKSISFSIQVDPSALSGRSPILHSKYVLPVLSNSDFNCLVLKPAVPWQKEILSILEEVFVQEAIQPFGYELEIRNQLCLLWMNLLRSNPTLLNSKKRSGDVSQVRIKVMLEMIHQNYGRKLSLNEIAASAHISSSECCRCFRKILGMTPFEYLVRYRIETAAYQLSHSIRSISDISEAAGFSKTSYFYQTFKKITGQTPLEYRKRFL